MFGLKEGPKALLWLKFPLEACLLGPNMASLLGLEAVLLELQLALLLEPLLLEL
jgi:hypothetical protein